MRSIAAAARTYLPSVSIRTVFAECLALVWLMADQGVFALSNFVTNVLFARWLLPIDYGMFAVSFTGYTLMTVFHFGAILEPLLVQSPRVAPERRHSYIVALIHAHLLMLASVGVFVMAGYGVTEVLHTPEIGLAIVGAGIGGSFMLMLLIARRLCLVFLSTRVSAIIGVVYLTGVISTTYAMHRYGQVVWFDLWLIMGGWSLLCSTIIFTMLYITLSGREPYTLTELWRFQWHYARYGLGASVCSWFRVDGIFLMLAQAAGLEVIAQTRAVLNLANPVIQVIIALHTSWLVGFSRDPDRLNKTLAIYCAGAALVVLMFAASYNQLVAWVYGGRFLEGAWLLPLYCVSQAFYGVEVVFSCFMKAVGTKAGGSLRRAYAPQFFGCVAALGLGALLIPYYDQRGYMTTIIFSFVLGAAISVSLGRLQRAAVIGQ